MGLIEGDEEHGWHLSPHGVDAVKQVVGYFEEGYSIEQIAEYMDFPEIGGDRAISLRVLVTTARLTGVID